jgi:GNAT superfamily N-acetyltransferase
MAIECRATELSVIQAMRDIYRHEMHCQIIHDSLHVRPGWTTSYLLTIDGAPAGYGSETHGGPWKDKPTIFEFFVLPPLRSRTFELFAVFFNACGIRAVETQSNGDILSTLLAALSESVVAEAILYEDRITTALSIPGASVRATTLADAERLTAAQLSPEDKWLVELNGEIAGSGGILYHYNRPYGDIYMAIAEPFRRRGLGAFLVQELKRICYEQGSIPAARCGTTNFASRATLQKAGFVPCGNIVTGTIAATKS